MLLQFFGVITLRHFPADPAIFQTDHLRATFDWNALGRLFTDPVGLLESRYGWGTADFQGQEFVTNLGAVLELFGEPARVRQLPRRVEEQLAGTMVPEADTSPATQLLFSIDRSFDVTGGHDVGLALYPLRPSAPGATDAGMAITPYAHGAEQLSFEIAPQIKLEFDSTVALDSGVALAFRPGQSPKLKGGLLGDDGVVDSIDGHALVRLTLAAPAGGRLTLLSFPGGGLLDVDSIAFAGGIEAAQGRLSPSFGAKLRGGRAAIKPGESDSFLSSILPANGVELKFDLGMRWSATGHELRRLGGGRDRLSASLLDRPAAHRRAPRRAVAVQRGHRPRDELRGEHEPRAAHRRRRPRGRAGDARVPRRQSRADRPLTRFQAAVGDRSRGRRAGRCERRRFPVPRCGDRHATRA